MWSHERLGRLARILNLRTETHTVTLPAFHKLKHFRHFVLQAKELHGGNEAIEAPPCLGLQACVKLLFITTQMHLQSPQGTNVDIMCGLSCVAKQHP